MKIDQEPCTAEAHRNCFNLTKVLNVSAQGEFEDITITKENWTDVIDATHRIDPNIPVWRCLQIYSVCPNGIISPLSLALYETYTACGGFGNISPSDYFEMSAFYSDAVKVINRERNRIAKMRKTENTDGDQ